MATKQNPEERSPQGTEPVAKGAAHPTGEEVKKEGQASASAQAGGSTGAKKGAAAAKKTNGSTASKTPGGRPDGARVAQLDAVASEYYGRLADAAERLSEQTRTVYGQCCGYVRKHPGGVFLGAVAVGLLVGAASRRN